MVDSAPKSAPQNADQRKLRKLVAEARENERQIRNQVARLRRAGDSWATIAQYLGVTQQAAHKRFAR